MHPVPPVSFGEVKLLRKLQKRSFEYFTHESSRELPFLVTLTSDLFRQWK